MIWELRHEFTIKLLLEVSGLARSTYYYYIKHRNDEDKYSEIKEQITNIFCENKERYGYRRITMELRNRGYSLNHKTVLRLMKEQRIKCRVRIKKYHSYKGEVGKVAPNLLERDFSTTAPNEKWVTDVTEFSLFGQKLYVALYQFPFSFHFCEKPSHVTGYHVTFLFHRKVLVNHVILTSELFSFRLAVGFITGKKYGKKCHNSFTRFISTLT